MQPLFVENRTMLLQALNLSNAPNNSDLPRIMDRILQRVKNGFYRKLGISRVVTLLGYPTTFSSPPTKEEILRSICTDTEIKWCQYEVNRQLRSVYLESGSIIAQWNDETPYRNKTIEELVLESQTLIQELEENFQLLSGAEELGSESYGEVTTLEDDKRPLPGQSLYGWELNRKFIIPYALE